MILFNIDNDCLYKNFKNRYQNEIYYQELLYKSGFLDEQRTQIDQEAINDYKLLSLPIRDIPESDSLAVIVTTGSFSPLHEGHIEAMTVAKKYVENLGHKVIQGVISLSHDGYVSYKNGGLAKLHVGNRTQIVYDKIKDIDWITVDRFEGELVSCPINFSTVLQRIKCYFNYHTNKNIKIFYVFGSDNASFSYSFVDNDDYQSICVERSTYDYTKVAADLNSFPNIHFIKNKSIYSGYSSTEVRKAYKPDRDDSQEDHLIYLIRTDDVPLDFAEQLKSIVAKYLNKKVEIKLFDSKDLSYDVSNCISMDKYVKGEYSLDVSRVFQLSGYQNKAQGMCSLKEDLNLQISKIPKGDYKLIDDDSVSGYTMKEITKLLSLHDVNITDTDCLVSSILKKGESLYDIIDARDFLLGSNNGGLVVSLFGKTNIRVPYMFPLVNLTTRANILPEYHVQFTKEILELNQSFSSVQYTPLLKNLCYNDNNEFIKKYLMYINNYLGV
jgi:nicotinic acid mononucleotide adenylyltransferase